MGYEYKEMRKNPTSQSGLFNPRVLAAFTLCFIGFILATLCFAAGPLTWSPTGTMVTPRQNHTATAFSACEVLIVGGDLGTDHSIQATALLYEIALGTWRNAGTMHAEREFHTATLLPPSQPTGASKVLVAGGIGNDGVPLATAEVDDPLGNLNTGVWSLTGSMSTARYAHTATLLSNGNVLVAGGIDANGAPLASAELFDPTSGTWSATGNMLTARHDQTAVFLTSGKVLVTGGIGANGAILSSAELYDPTTGTWGAAGNMTSARVSHTATVLTTGFVLLNGGRNSSGALASAELYNPVTGGFATTGGMNFARQFHTAFLLSSGQVLVAGGKNSSSVLSSAELYDPGAGVWTTTGSMAGARQFHTASGLASFGTCGGINGGGPNNLVLVAGGRDQDGVLTTAELYNPDTGTWSATADMSTGRLAHASTLLSNGKVLVAGGTTGKDRGALASTVLYDPATGIFSATGSISDARSNYTLTLLPGGEVLATGGFGSNSNALASAALYDPATGKWSPTGSMNHPRYSHTATLLSNSNVLVAGGSGTGTGRLSCELYDPASGTWSNTGSLTAGRSSHTATLLSTGEVLIAGNVAPSELYDPATGTWSVTGSMNTSRALHTATLLPTGKVLAAGGGNGGALYSAELYDRTSGTWSITATMSSDRAVFPAVLLSNGTVLAAGGDTHLGPTAACDIYDGLSGTWTIAGNMNQDRDWHTGTLLNTGKALVTGGVNLAGDVLSTAELFDPGAPLSLFSCDGVDVVTDPAGDAINPAPGGAGPTDQADIIGMSFSTDAPQTNLITTMTLHNLSQVPSPGTTFTTYNVVWTSSNGFQYATQVTAPDPSGSLSYFWGPWDPRINKIASLNATTGTFNAGANGTITVNVPLSGIGSPTIPITDFSQAAAVTNPFGLTFAGEGALGNGATFVNPMDVAPDSGGGARWAVCPLPVQLTGVISRKVHGSAGTFDLDLPLDGSGIECRSGGAGGDYTIIFTFVNPVTHVDAASVTSGTGTVSDSAIGSDPHQYIVSLTRVTNAQRLSVTLTNVQDATGDFSNTLSILMGVLLGDVNASGRVDAADVSLARQQTLQPITSSNFREDINTSGRIDAADVSIARQQTLTSLP